VRINVFIANDFFWRLSQNPLLKYASFVKLIMYDNTKFIAKFDLEIGI